nr:ATP-binding protein [Clostridia bacterium]
ESGKDFTLNVEEELSIFGNAPNIERLVNILLDNAIQYSQARGRIRLTLKSHGNRAQLSVFNTGSGLTREEMSKVFRRFYRSDASRSSQTGGYGLGLSIAQAIVLQHKGKISVAGEYGKSITFSASFRLAEKGAQKTRDEISRA